MTRERAAISPAGFRRALALAACLLLPPAWSVAAAPPPEALAEVQRRVAQVPVLRGEFRQEKQVAGFAKPLRSQGRFTVARERGVVWTTLSPFPSELVLTRERIVSRQRDGGTRVEVDARQQPGLRSVNAMMFALMSGDVQALTGTFDVQAEAPAGAAWRMSLKPRSRALAQAFASIQLAGDRYVRSVEIREANGDVTRLDFAALDEAPARLSPEEEAKFD